MAANAPAPVTTMHAVQAAAENGSFSAMIAEVVAQSQRFLLDDNYLLAKALTLQDTIRAAIDTAMQNSQPIAWDSVRMAFLGYTWMLYYTFNRHELDSVATPRNNDSLTNDEDYTTMRMLGMLMATPRENQHLVRTRADQLDEYVRAAIVGHGLAPHGVHEVSVILTRLTNREELLEMSIVGHILELLQSETSPYRNVPMRAIVNFLNPNRHFNYIRRTMALNAQGHNVNSALVFFSCVGDLMDDRIIPHATQEYAQNHTLDAAGVFAEFQTAVMTVIIAGIMHEARGEIIDIPPLAHESPPPHMEEQAMLPQPSPSAGGCHGGHRKKYYSRRKM